MLFNAHHFSSTFHHFFIHCSWRSATTLGPRTAVSPSGPRPLRRRERSKRREPVRPWEVLWDIWKYRQQLCRNHGTNMNKIDERTRTLVGLWFGSTVQLIFAVETNLMNHFANGTWLESSKIAHQNLGKWSSSLLRLLALNFLRLFKHISHDLTSVINISEMSGNHFFQLSKLDQKVPQKQIQKSSTNPLPHHSTCISRVTSVRASSGPSSKHSCRCRRPAALRSAGLSRK